MAKRDVTGLHHVFSKGHEYWYAWRGRGAPLISKDGSPSYGSPDFWAAYDAAIRERHVPEPGKFRALVTLYRASADFRELAPSTKKHWSPWLDRIADYFDLSIAAFDNPKIRKVIWQWRNKYTATPRAADMGMQVLSRVCAYAVEQGSLAGNPCEGIGGLYANDRSAIIWTEASIARIKPHCPSAIAHAIDLAAATGLRRSDLLRLSWSHIHDDEGEIRITTGKSKHRQEAIIPLYDGLREVLARIPRRSPVVLTSSRGRPWGDSNFGMAFHATKTAAGIGPELHFHDLRGTAATRFYIAGLPLRVIAEILGWTEASVDKIIRKYVDRSAATKAIILQLNKPRS